MVYEAKFKETLGTLFGRVQVPMKKITACLCVGCVLLAGTAAAAPASGKYNEKATQLFIQHASRGAITPESLKMFKSKNADINVMYDGPKGVKTNLLLDCMSYDNNDERAAVLRDGSVNLPRELFTRFSVLGVLVTMDADFKVTNSKGQNPANVAVLNSVNENFSVYLMKVCKRYGASLDQPDNKKGTPLMYAIIRHGELSMRSISGNINPLVKYLLDSGANVNQADATGATVLMYAAMFSNLKTVTYLVEHGANLSAKDKAGHGVIDYAKNRQKITDYLNAKALEAL